MSGTIKENECVLSVQLNSKFTPSVPNFEIRGRFPQTIMYWVVGEDGKEKKYLDATPKEIKSWVYKNLPPDTAKTTKKLLLSFNEESLLLANNKAYYLGLVIKAITERSRINCLFGKPQQWDKIEEWVRLKKAELIDSRKDNSEEK